MINWAGTDEPRHNNDVLDRVTLSPKQLAAIGIYSNDTLYVTKDGAYRLDGEKFLGKRYRIWHWWWGYVAKHTISYWDGDETWTRVLGDAKRGHAGKFLPLRDLRLPFVVFGVKGTKIEDHTRGWCDAVSIKVHPGSEPGQWVKIIDIQFDDSKSHFGYQTLSDSEEFTDGEILTALTTLILGFDRLSFTERVDIARGLRFRQGLEGKCIAEANPGHYQTEHPCPQTVLSWLNTQDNIPERFKKAYPSLHYCAEWDYMVIDRFCPEFEACSCLKIQDPTCEDALDISNKEIPVL